MKVVQGCGMMFSLMVKVCCTTFIFLAHGVTSRETSFLARVLGSSDVVTNAIDEPEQDPAEVWPVIWTPLHSEGGESFAFAMGSLTASFSKDVQLGRGAKKVDLLESGTGAIQQIPVTVNGQSATFDIAKTEPAKGYRLKIRAGFFVSTDNTTSPDIVYNFTTSGPRGDTWTCALGAECDVRGILGTDLPNWQVGVVLDDADCPAAALGHPLAWAPAFQSGWKPLVQNGMDGSATVQLGVPPFATASVGSFTLCAKPILATGSAAPLGVISILGPQYGQYRPEKPCLAGVPCHINLAMLPAESVVQIRRDACTTAAPALYEAVVDSSMALSVPLQAGTLKICWRRSKDDAEAVEIDAFRVLGPLSLKGHEVTAFDGSNFDVVLSCEGHPPDARLKFEVAAEDESKPPCSTVTTDRSLLAVNAALLSSGGMAVSTGDGPITLKWISGSLRPGSYRACWIANPEQEHGEEWLAVGVFQVTLPSCGNGRREGDEECDDGNTDAEDGCDATCVLESGYTCAYDARAKAELCALSVQNLAAEATVIVTGDGDDVTVVVDASHPLIDGTGLQWLLPPGSSGEVLLKFPIRTQLQRLHLDLPEMESGEKLKVSLESRATGGEEWEEIARFDAEATRSISDAEIDLMDSGTWQANDELAEAVKLRPPGVPVVYMAAKHSLQVKMPGYIVKELRLRLEQAQPNVQTTALGLRELRVNGVPAQRASCSAAMVMRCELANREPCSDGTEDESCGECLPGFEGAASPSVEQCASARQATCLLSDWSAWAPCSTSCGPGFTWRERGILRHPDVVSPACPRLRERLPCHPALCIEVSEPRCDAGSDLGPRRLQAIAPSPQAEPASVRRLSEDELNRRLQEEDVPPELRTFMDELNAMTGLEERIVAADESDGEDFPSTGCEVSSEGKLVSVPLNAESRAQLKRNPVDCGSGMYLAASAVACSSPKQDEDCETESGQEAPANTSCTFQLCCEPCDARCKHCSGPGVDDCLQCPPDDVQFFHPDGRSTCISQATCSQKDCFRIQKDEQGDWHCVPEVNDPRCIYVAGVYPWQSEDEELQALEDAEVCFMQEMNTSAARAALRRPAADPEARRLRELDLRRLGVDGKRVNPDSLRCEERSELAFAQQDGSGLASMTSDQKNALLSGHITKFMEESVGAPLEDTALQVFNETVGRPLQMLQDSLFSVLLDQLTDGQTDLFMNGPTPDHLLAALKEQLSQRILEAIPTLKSSLRDSILDRICPPQLTTEAGNGTAAAAETDLRRNLMLSLRREATEHLELRANLPGVVKHLASAANQRVQQDGTASPEDLAGVLAESDVAVVDRHVEAITRKVPEALQSPLALAPLKTTVLETVGAIRKAAENLTNDTAMLHTAIPLLRETNQTLEGKAEEEAKNIIRSVAEEIRKVLHSGVLTTAQRVEASALPLSGVVRPLQDKINDVLLRVVDEAARSLGQFGTADDEMLRSAVAPLTRVVRTGVGRILKGLTSKLFASVDIEVMETLTSGISKATDWLTSKIQALVSGLVNKAMAGVTAMLLRLGDTAGISQIAVQLARGVAKALSGFFREIADSNFIGELWNTITTSFTTLGPRILERAELALEDAVSAAGQIARDFQQMLIDGAIQAISNLISRQAEVIAVPSASGVLMERIEEYAVERFLPLAEAALARLEGRGLLTAEDASKWRSLLETTGSIPRRVREALTSLPQRIAASLSRAIAAVIQEKVAEVSPLGIRRRLTNDTLHDKAADQVLDVRDQAWQRVKDEAGLVLMGVAAAILYFMLEDAASSACEIVMPALHLHLFRETEADAGDGKVATLGRLVATLTNAAGVSTVQSFYTLEPGWVDSLRSTSRIPAGEYIVEVGQFKHPPCGLDVLRLKRVKDRTGIALICGNYRDNTAGAILVGSTQQKEPKPAVFNSKDAMIELLAMASNGTHQISITVEEIRGSGHEMLHEMSAPKQSRQEQVARLAYGVYFKPHEPASSFTYAAEGWTYLFSVYNNNLIVDTVKDWAHISIKGASCAIAFVGTEDLEDWEDNVDIFTEQMWVALPLPDGGRLVHEVAVHSGFKEEYEDYKAGANWARWEQMYKNPDICSEVIVIGHSLGGAVATLHRFDLAAEHNQAKTWLYTFGAPRTFWVDGDEDVFRTASCSQSFRYWRQDASSGCGDLVTGVPPFYRHGFTQEVKIEQRDGEVEQHPSELGCNGNGGAETWPALTCGTGVLQHAMTGYIAALLRSEEGAPPSCPIGEGKGPVLHMEPLEMDSDTAEDGEKICPGDHLTVKWKACQVNTVRVTLQAAGCEDASADSGYTAQRQLFPSLVQSWVVDARRGQILVVIPTVEGSQPPWYRIQLEDTTQEEVGPAPKVESRWMRSCTFRPANNARRMQVQTFPYPPEVEQAMELAADLGNALARGVESFITDLIQEVYGQAIGSIEKLVEAAKTFMSSLSSASSEEVVVGGMNLLALAEKELPTIVKTIVQSELPAIGTHARRTVLDAQGMFFRQLQDGIGGVVAVALPQSERGASDAMNDDEQAALYFLKITQGDGEPTCEPKVVADVDSLVKTLIKIKHHEMFKAFGVFAGEIATTTDIGYDLAGSIFSVAQSLETFRFLMTIIGTIPFPPVQKVAIKVKNFLTKVAAQFEKYFLEPAEWLVDNLLDPGCKFGNMIHKRIIYATSKMEALALVLRLMMRPPTETFKNVARQMGICKMLKEVSPVAEAARGLEAALDRLGRGIPAKLLNNKNPFKGQSRTIVGAFKSVASRLRSLSRPFRGVMKLMDKRFEVCLKFKLGFVSVKKCWGFRVRDIFKISGWLQRLFSFVFSMVSKHFGFLNSLTKGVLDFVTKTFLGLPRNFIADGLDLDFSEAGNAPDISRAIGSFQADPVRAVLETQRAVLAPCSLGNTAMFANSQPWKDDRCAQWDGSWVFLAGECEKRCLVDCSDCDRAFAIPSSDGPGYTCHLRQRGTGYFREQGSMVVLAGEVCKKDQLCFWETEPLTRMCTGENIFETGIATAEECKQKCCHDRDCFVFQFNQAKGICQMGVSFDCDGEPGWHGWRKARTAQEDVKKLCDTWGLARDLEDSYGSVSIDEEYTSYARQSQSSCFQSVCHLNSLDINCTAENEFLWDKQLSEQCEDIPKWEVGEWSPCSEGVCGRRGTQWRDVKCTHPDEQECYRMPGQLGQKPERLRDCLQRESCRWQFTAWSNCSATTCLETGWKTREVYCPGDPDGCDEMAKPVSEITCRQMENCSQCFAGEQPPASLENEPWVDKASSAALGRRLHRQLQSQPASQTNRTKSKRLSPQACADLAVKLGSCRMQMVSARPMDRGGAAGVVLQMQWCQSAQLDDMAKSMDEIRARLPIIEDKMDRHAAETQALINDEFRKMENVTQVLIADAVAEQKVAVEESQQQILRQLRHSFGAVSQAMACNGNRNYKVVLAAVENLEEMLEEDLTALREDLAQGISNITGHLVKVEGRIKSLIFDVAGDIKRNLAEELGDTEARMAEAFQVAMRNMTASVRSLVRAEQNASDARVMEHISNEVETAAALVIEGVDGKLQEQLNRSRETVSALIRDQSQLLLEAVRTEVHRSREDSIAQLSVEMGRVVSNATSQLDANGRERMARLEDMVKSLMTSASQEEAARIKVLHAELTRGNVAAMDALDSGLRTMSQDIGNDFGTLQRNLVAQSRSLERRVESGIQELSASLEESNEVVSQIEDNVEVLTRMGNQSLEAIARVEGGIDILHKSSQQTHTAVLTGQRQTDANLAAISLKIDSVAAEIEALKNMVEKQGISHKLSRFQEHATFIDGALMDVQTLMQRAGAVTREVVGSLESTRTCSSSLPQFAQTMRKEQGEMLQSRKHISNIWPTVRDHFANLVATLVDSGLLRSMFEIAPLMVTKEEFGVAEKTLFQGSRHGRNCRLWFSNVGTQVVRELLQEKLEGQPFLLLNRTAAIYAEVQQIAAQQEAFGQRVPRQDREYLDGLYARVVEEVGNIRHRLSLPQKDGISNMRQQMHMNLLDLWLPDFCKPARSCVDAIFAQHQEVRTGELVEWRTESQDVTVVVRKPSELLRLPGIFEWAMDLRQPASIPASIPADFVHGVYVCTTLIEGDDGRMVALTASTADDSHSDAFQFCGSPASLVHTVSDTVLACSASLFTNHSSYAEVAVDTFTPTVELVKTFGPWEEEAQRLSLSSICGNGIVEAGENCDEGEIQIGCQDCREVLPGFACDEPGRPCVARCGDGLVFSGVEGCDSAGFRQGCSEDCQIMLCSRYGAVTSLGEHDVYTEMDTVLRKTYGQSLVVGAWLGAQGYRQCFTESVLFAGEESDIGYLIESCVEAQQISFVGKGPTGVDVRHDVELEEVQHDVENMMLVWVSGPHMFRVKVGEDWIMQLSCRVPTDVWDRCILWSVRHDGERVLSQDGTNQTTIAKSDSTLSLAVWIHEDDDWGCSDGDRAVQVCGDGVVVGSEECDDGNTVSLDGCSSECQMEHGWICSPGRPCIWAWCGDGVAGNSSELCDDGGLHNDDALDSAPSTDVGCRSCIVQPAWICHSKCEAAARARNATMEERVREFFGHSSSDPSQRECCLKGPAFQDFACILGEACSIAVQEVPWSSGKSGIFISELDGTGEIACHSPLRHPSFRGFRGDGNEQDLDEIVLSTGHTYEIGTISRGSTQTEYALCWGYDPQADWAAGVGDLRSSPHDASSSYPVRPRNFSVPFPLGRFTLYGPTQDLRLTCIVGLRCDADIGLNGDMPLSEIALVEGESCDDMNKGQNLAKVASLHVLVKGVSSSSSEDSMPEVIVDGDRFRLPTGHGLLVVSFQRSVGMATTLQQALAVTSDTDAETIESFLQLHRVGVVFIVTGAEGMPSLPPPAQQILVDFGVDRDLLRTEGEAFAFVADGPSNLLFQQTDATEAALAVSLPTQLKPQPLSPLGKMSFEPFSAGAKKEYHLCWAALGYPGMAHGGIHFGHLLVQGPSMQSKVQCWLGSQCSVVLQGSGLELGSVVAAHGTEDGCLTGDHLAEHLSAFTSSVDPNGSWAVYNFGFLSNRSLLGQWPLCWRASEVASSVFATTLQVEEQKCTLQGVAPEWQHNCTGVNFGESCKVRCRQGWAGAAQDLRCAPDGELIGHVPVCRMVACSTASVHGVRAADECLCGPGYYGKLLWLQDQERYIGDCTPCVEVSLKCAVGEYRHACGGNSSGECLPCANHTMGKYWITNGGLDPRGCGVQDCQLCKKGEYPDGCGGTSRGICQPCTNLEGGEWQTHYFTGAGDVTGTCPVQECDPSSCGVGSFLQGCGSTSPGFCQSCSRPAAGFYHSSSGGLRDECDQTPCEPCEAGFFRSGCEGGSQGLCVQCTNAGEGYYYSGSGGLRNECPVQECPLCPAGLFRSGCKGISNGTCVLCKKKAAGTYFVEGDDCPYEDCGQTDLVCPVGQYRHNCGHPKSPASSGTCMPCDVKTHHYALGPGTNHPQSCPTASCEVCPVGFFKNGCGPILEGNCTPCGHTKGYYFTTHGGFADIPWFAPRPRGLCKEVRCEASVSSCDPGEFQSSCGEDEFHTNAGSCADCPAGKFSETRNALSCINCEPGQFSLAKSSECIACPDGHYAPSSGAPKCLPCRGGYVINGTTCEHCPIGRYGDSLGNCLECIGGNVVRAESPELASMCEECQDGEFNDGSQDECKPCVGGSTSRNWPDTCTTCPVGQFSRPDRSDCEASLGCAVSADRSDCMPCELGHFSPGVLDECVLCVGGYVDPGRTACIPCKQRTWNNGSYAECQPCVGGQVSIGADRCEPCPVGWYDAGDLRCRSCAGGTTNAARTTCTPCPVGSWSAEGTNQCVSAAGGEVHRLADDRAPKWTPCADGTYNPGTFDECQACEGGETSANKTVCTPCTAGMVRHTTEDKCVVCRGQSRNSATTCRQCPSGYYHNGSSMDDCVQCIGGYTLFDSGAHTFDVPSAVQCIACETGQYDKGDFDECVDCQGQVNEDSTACEECPAGKWSPPGTGECQSCVGFGASRRRASRCEVCPPGQYDGGDFDECFRCLGVVKRNGDGTESCLDCPSGYYKLDMFSDVCEYCPLWVDRSVPGGECKPCPAGQHKYNRDSDDCEPCRAGQNGSRCELYFVPEDKECAAGDEATTNVRWAPRTCTGSKHCCSGGVDRCTTSASVGSETSPPSCSYNICARRLEEGEHDAEAEACKHEGDIVLAVEDAEEAEDALEVEDEEEHLAALAETRGRRLWWSRRRRRRRRRAPPPPRCLARTCTATAAQEKECRNSTRASR